MNPLLAFRPLATDIKHAVSEVTNNKGGLGNASGFDTRTQHVLVVGNIIGLRDAVDRFKVAVILFILFEEEGEERKVY